MMKEISKSNTQHSNKVENLYTHRDIFSLHSHCRHLTAFSLLKDITWCSKKSCFLTILIHRGADDEGDIEIEYTSFKLDTGTLILGLYSHL
jgi:hypothetical protein